MAKYLEINNANAGASSTPGLPDTERARGHHTRTMLSITRGTRRPDSGLFPSEREIARRLSQDLSGWKARATILEREGLPRVCPIMGGRYWPSVMAYFNHRYGLGNVAPSAMDGMENLDAL